MQGTVRQNNSQGKYIFSDVPLFYHNHHSVLILRREVVGGLLMDVNGEEISPPLKLVKSFPKIKFHIKPL